VCNSFSSFFFHFGAFGRALRPRRPDPF
jgi:hypothetical protein